MNLREQKGFTGSDIIISVIILFIFVSLIATLFYNFSTSNKDIERKSEAVNIAVTEIEQIKNNSFETYEGISVANGNNVRFSNEPVTGKTGYYKTIEIQDYNDIDPEKQADVVKKVIVTITYKFKNQDQTVELATIISKES